MSNEAKVGVFVFIVIVVFVGLSMKIGEITFNKSATYPMTMVFSSVEGLKPGATLELAGVVVGKVENIELNKDYSATVGVSMNEDVQLPIDSTASISTKGVLGDKIIVLSPGISKSILKPNGNLARTELPPSLDYIMTQLGVIATNLSDLTTSLNNALGGEEGLSNLRTIMENINNLTSQMDLMLVNNRENFSSMIMNMEHTSSNLSLISDNLTQTSTDFGAIIGDVRAGEGSLGKLLTDDKLYLYLTDSVEKMQILTTRMSEDNNLTMFLSDNTLYYDLLNITGNLRLVSEQIASGNGTLGRLVADDELYRELTETIRSANKAARGLEEQTPITIMGTVLGTVLK